MRRETFLSSFSFGGVFLCGAMIDMMLKLCYHSMIKHNLIGQITMNNNTPMRSEELLIQKIKNCDFLNKFSEREFTQNFYAALCNTEWEDQNHNVISFSWRSAGRFVAELRNEYCYTLEDYLDYYCSGIQMEDSYDPNIVKEGTVTPEISELMESIGMVMTQQRDDLCQILQKRTITNGKNFQLQRTGNYIFHRQQHI